jgi:hypothetical protein
VSAPIAADSQHEICKTPKERERRRGRIRINPGGFGQYLRSFSTLLGCGYYLGTFFAIERIFLLQILILARSRVISKATKGKIMRCGRMAA